LESKRIVITGAPGTGKTAIINNLESASYFCYHEVVRSMTKAAKLEQNTKKPSCNPLAFVKDAAAFNELLLKARHAHFSDAKGKLDPFVFYDRGMPDVLAYMDYFNQKFTTAYSNTCLSNRYDTVFILPPWKKIYKQDEERMETFEQAVALHSHLVKTYKSLGYPIIFVPFDSISNRQEFIISHLNKAFGAS